MTGSGAGGLRLSGVTVTFGGRVAVSDLSLHAPAGRVTGLIGPNGAGKTTTFNVCSGLQQSSTGAVHIDGKDATRLSPHRRAQLGLGRTFQRMELFESLTVRQNVEMSAEARFAGSRPVSHLWARPAERDAIRTATDSALADCHVEEFAHRPVSALSTGQRRLVDLARAAAAAETFLLLDEPSSGLDHAETTVFGEILAGLVSQRGTGILLVEHDMNLVMTICDYLYVLDFGQLIFEGTPSEVAASPVVRHAYLGEPA